jgi:hypothetical protein
MIDFNAPIPGQSLTKAPKQFPWERPPVITDPEEAIQMHLTRISQPDQLEAVIGIFEMEDLSIKTVTNGIIRGAVANGIHSIDVGMFVAPVLHEFLKQATKAVGLEVDEGFLNKKAKAEERNGLVIAKARKMLAKMDINPAELAKAAEAEPTAATPPVAPQAAPMEAPPKGLMARGEM